MADWIKNRINLARKLYRGECGGDYKDAVIILASIISGIASRIWPGDQKDKMRFVESLVRFCPDELNLTRISIPLLVEDLYEKNTEASIQLRSHFDKYGTDRYLDTRIYTGKEIDKTETETLRIAPSLTTQMVRSHSYAYLFYKEVRSGLVHEYRLTDRASKFPMTRETQDV